MEIFRIPYYIWVKWMERDYNSTKKMLELFTELHAKSVEKAFEKIKLNMENQRFSKSGKFNNFPELEKPKMELGNGYVFIHGNNPPLFIAHHSGYTLKKGNRDISTDLIAATAAVKLNCPCLFATTPRKIREEPWFGIDYNRPCPTEKFDAEKVRKEDGLQKLMLNYAFLALDDEDYELKNSLYNAFWDKTKEALGKLNIKAIFSIHSTGKSVLSDGPSCALLGTFGWKNVKLNKFRYNFKFDINEIKTAYTSYSLDFLDELMFRYGTLKMSKLREAYEYDLLKWWVKTERKRSKASGDELSGVLKTGNYENLAKQIKKIVESYKKSEFNFRVNYRLKGLSSKNLLESLDVRKTKSIQIEFIRPFARLYPAECANFAAHLKNFLDGQKLLV